MNLLPAWQQGIWKTLTHHGALRSHAWLLKGRRGIGKYWFASLLAKSLLCTRTGPQCIACGQCASCNWFDQHTHPNFKLITPDAMSLAMALDNKAGTEDHSAKTRLQTAGERKTKPRTGQQISIDQIRGLDDFVYLTGHQAGYKIVLIYPAETMNTPAANALLKKLEEPPENTLFILVTHQSQRLLPTVRSRCLQIAMPAPDIDAAVQWLLQHWPQQADAKKSTEPQQLNKQQDAHRLLALSGFSPFAALPLLETMEQHRQFIDAVSTHGRFDPLTLAEAMQKQELTVTIDWLQKWCYDLAAFHAAERVRYHPFLEARIQSLCQRINLRACLSFLQFLNARQSLSRHPVNERLFLEEIFIQYGRLLAAGSTVPEFEE
ncbi:DNA polymerase III subunit delta' [Nitrosomonas marina]|uniref:DNA polymerase III subunit delta' n=1 Tax=Nitrosomonas marina TaxID=917 RepID=A0A1H8H254_9PROT|nr:DNA polymerase III subunit delta' [Nitrosomonas marina]SEN50481.1 DNA polymerase III, delta prime subunit [Nitrosomonas marina]